MTPTNPAVQYHPCAGRHNTAQCLGDSPEVVEGLPLLMGAVPERVHHRGVEHRLRVGSVGQVGEDVPDRFERSGPGAWVPHYCSTWALRRPGERVESEIAARAPERVGHSRGLRADFGKVVGDPARGAFEEAGPAPFGVHLHCIGTTGAFPVSYLPSIGSESLGQCIRQILIDPGRVGGG
jgi:hypothetical protein